MSEKFTIPTETIELPSQGKIYETTNPLSSGAVEMKYMTAREEDILTNVNVDFSIFKNKNEFTYQLPHSKNTVTFKLFTVEDEKAIDAEIKSLKKVNLSAGEITTRLKRQILSVNGDYEPKTVREFVDNALIAKDSNPLRSYIGSITPDIDLTVNFTLSSGKEVEESLPLTAEFFFPGS